MKSVVEAIHAILMLREAWRGNKTLQMWKWTIPWKNKIRNNFSQLPAPILLSTSSQSDSTSGYLPKMSMCHTMQTLRLWTLVGSSVCKRWVIFSGDWTALGGQGEGPLKRVKLLFLQKYFLFLFLQEAKLQMWRVMLFSREYQIREI